MNVSDSSSNDAARLAAESAKAILSQLTITKGSAGGLPTIEELAEELLLPSVIVVKRDEQLARMTAQLAAITSLIDDILDVPDRLQEHFGPGGMPDALLNYSRKRATLSKAEANYRPATQPGERCGTCSMFNAATRTCDLVTGVIRADHVCDHWEKRITKGAAPQPLPTGKQVDAGEVYDQLRDNFPESAIAFVKRTDWYKMRVPTARVDRSSEDKWAASHEPARVREFADEIKEGKHANPPVAVLHPDSNKIVLADGHHRWKARAELHHQPKVKMLVGYVSREDWPAASQMHTRQRHQGADPRNK